MSCRVINRTVEEFLFSVLVEEAQAKGVSRLIGRYVPTAKNGLVKDLYDRLGFRRSTEPDGSVVYDLEVADLPAIRTFVRRREAVSSGGSR